MKSHQRLALILALGVGGAGVALTGDHASAQVTYSDNGQRPVPPVHVVRDGDTLWGISGTYYDNPWAWPRLWSYNPEITNPHWIYPSDRIRLRAQGDEGSDLPQGVVQARPRMASETIWLRDQGYLDADERDRSGVIIGSREDQMLLAEHDEIYVRFGEDVTPTPGTVYTVYRNLDTSDRDDGSEGVLVRVLGAVRLLDYDQDEQIGRAIITESLQPIERGYPLAEIDRNFIVVPPRVNAQDVEASLVALLEPTVFLANQQVGFVDKGSEDGVQVGNRFFIVRSGDSWRDEQVLDRMELGESIPDRERPDEESYPDEVVGEARVVAVREHSATVVVTNSTRAVVIGDRAEMRAGF